VATGFHRPNEGEELRELIGNDWVFKNIRIVNHFAGRDADHIYLGTTPMGTPVKIDRRFVDSDLRIVVGLVEPHFMAGKILAVNTVIDEDRNLSFVNFGSLEESHLAAVTFARPYFEIPVDRKYKTVLTSASGYPLDRTYYQTVKGMVGVTDILEPDADIFIVSGCSEGLGSKEYAQSQTKLIEMGADSFLAETGRKECADVDEWETVMQIKAMKQGTIHLFSEGLSRAEKALTGVEVIENLPDAIQKCLAMKEDKHIAVIPEGPYAIPVYRPV
jgi:nickel-dependent lactate racemase